MVFVVCIPKKIHRISIFLFRPLSLKASNVVLGYRICLQVGWLSSLAYQRNTHSILHTEFSVGVYEIGNHVFYSHVHKLLLQTDTVFQTYTLIERFKQNVFDEGYAAYLHIIDFYTESTIFVSLPLTMRRIL